jgi:hypothetical protein
MKASSLSCSPSDCPSCCSSYCQSIESSRTVPIRDKGLQLGMDGKVAILDTLPCYTLGTSTTARRVTIKPTEKGWSKGVYGQDLSSNPRVF